MGQTYIDRFEVIAELGRGGMATVFQAYDPDFDRPVAIKVMPREFLHVPDFKTRFQREARIIANLEHNAIVPVYELGEHDDLPYLVMRYMPGGSLSNRIAHEPLALSEVNHIFSHIAPAVDKAHAQGFVHRDLKPDNILFDADNNAFIADFGIAKLMHSTSQLTGSGALVGTPAYMSPEQIMDQGEIDHRSDLYSMGVILYEVLTGQMPFLVESAHAYYSAHLNNPIPDIRDARPDLPPAFSSIIYRAMAKDKNERYQSAADLAADVAHALDSDVTAGNIEALPVDSPPTRRLPYALIGAGLVGLLLLGILLSGILRDDEPRQVTVRITATTDPQTAAEPTELSAELPTELPTATVDPTAAPDLPGRDDGWIVFDSDRDDTLSRRREIYKIRADGQFLTRLTLDEWDNYDPAWSPDGTQIVFVSDRDGDTELYIMDEAGSSIRRLTDSPGFDTQPDWSPDGGQIVFVSERDGNPELYLIDVDGSQTTRLTDNRARDESPAWSPDGSQLAFSSARGGYDRIWIKDLVSGYETIFTTTTDPALNPAWSPDGLHLAYDAFPSTGPSLQIAMQHIESGLVSVLASSSRGLDPTSATWSPSGQWLAYINGKGGGGGSCCTDTFDIGNIRVLQVDNPVPIDLFREINVDNQNLDWWAPSAES